MRPKRLQDVRVPVSMHADGDTLIVDVGAAPEKSDRRAATVWLAIAKEVETVTVTRGENRGRDLSYHHPVRELSPIGMWQRRCDDAPAAAQGPEDHGRRLPRSRCCKLRILGRSSARARAEASAPRSHVPAQNKDGPKTDPLQTLGRND